VDFKIAVLSGDGIGPEVTLESVKILESIGARFGHTFKLQNGEVGGCSIDKNGVAITDETLNDVLKCDSVLFGAVGGPKWDVTSEKERPENGILKLRKELDLFANIRPVKVYKDLIYASPLKPEIVDDVDFIIIRELTSGLYFGEPKKRWSSESGTRESVDTLYYNENEIERVLRVGFELAMGREKKLHSLDKMNVMATSRLWREVATELSKEYPEVELIHMLADNAAMQLVTNPNIFDVIVTENTFGDILSDEAAVIGGSMGLLPSASLSSVPDNQKKTLGLYEPIHGSAPDIAGQGFANPIASILSTSMMLRWSFGLNDEADLIDNSIDTILSEGYRTRDISKDNENWLNTSEIGDLISNKINS
jgi:3-isopropylmalate dehydrogenase